RRFREGAARSRGFRLRCRPGDADPAHGMVHGGIGARPARQGGRRGARHPAAPGAAACRGQPARRRAVTAAAPRSMSLLRGIGLRRFITPLVLVAGWQALAMSGMFRPFFMPPLQLVAARFVELLSSGVLLEAAAASLASLFAGFLGAVVVGI